MSTSELAEQPPVTPAAQLRVPERAVLEGLEAKWSARWEAEGTYRFDRAAERAEVYSVDTPPPTVSGSLHVGHVFHYTHADVIARFQRMRHKAVFYPIGWDDNGLPTERRVQNHYGVRCDPSVAYDPNLVPPGASGGREATPVSRPNFVELCERLTEADEAVFEALFRRLGLSVDWSFKYTTISPESRRVSQLAFLHLLASDEAYRQQAPTLWDVDFQTAVAQAELEDRQRPGAYHRVRFGRAGGGFLEIETTRPELLPACVALVAHPDDERCSSLFGSTARTPLFGVDVPILAHRLAAPDKGTGIAMVCTFGDLTDVTWWRDLALPTRNVIGRDGRFLPAPFGTTGWESTDVESAQRHYAELAGRTVNQARRRIVELLAESGDLLGEPKPIEHAVKFYERGERPLEIVTSSQWYVRTMRLADELLAAGRELEWHPAFMRARYEDWVNGLTGDWNISRQRFFGVPFPVWYPLDEHGEADGSRMILAETSALPVDPSTDTPPGYSPDQRGQPDGFAGDPDVMDTWATSSLSPQIAGRWVDDPDLFARVFPMDLRPQGHDIIRTWLFTTVVRSLLEHGELPWRHVALSGWILDPDRKKMSKSRGNVVVPDELLKNHGSDAVRYWSASARLGMDATFDEQQMGVGRRLALKVLNATRFVLGTLAAALPAGDSDGPPSVTPAPSWLHAVDAALLARIATLVEEATDALEGYDHARALERSEQVFWMFCDDYLELVKTRAQSQGTGGDSARRALRLALDVLLRLLAPVLPFATEEAWSWSHDGSIHLASWPDRDELDGAIAGSGSTAPPPGLLDAARAVLAEVRRAKTEAKRSLRAPVKLATVTGPPAEIGLLALAADDLRAAGAIDELRLVEGDDASLSVAVELG
jgi:valyl-tRNA synthetase